MCLCRNDIRQIHEALDREPGWKLAALEASVDAFREWLRRLAGNFARIGKSS